MLEGRVLDSNTLSLDLLKQVRQLEQESSALKAYVIELKAKVAIYVPAKNDPVD